VALLRWRAAAEARRRKLERELAAPMDSATRERVQRWLRNIEGREAWQSARLDHLVKVKLLLTHALERDLAPPPDPPAMKRGHRRRAIASTDGDE
jgi:hypothetical protein